MSSTMAPSRKSSYLRLVADRKWFACAPKRQLGGYFPLLHSGLPVHLRENLAVMKQSLMDAADRLLFGDLSAVVRSGELPIGRPLRGELTFACPRCGSPLCFVVEGTDIHLRVDKN